MNLSRIFTAIHVELRNIKHSARREASYIDPSNEGGYARVVAYNIDKLSPTRVDRYDALQALLADCHKHENSPNEHAQLKNRATALQLTYFGKPL